MRDDLGEFVERASSFGMRSVGRLGLPMHLYVQAVQETRSWQGKRAQFDSLRSLFTRATEPLYQARADKYHWHHLRGTFLPLEPETLAVALVVSQSWRATERPLEELYKKAELRKMEGVPLEIALAMSNGRGSSESKRREPL